MNTNTIFIRGALRILLALFFSLSLIGIPSGRASAGSPFVVNSDGDGGDLSLVDLVCATGTGSCTLRAAVQQANYNAGADTITFSPTTFVITLGSSLPSITGDLTIDGAGASVTISSNHVSRVMLINSSVTLNLNQLSIINSGSASVGASIYNQGYLTVTDSTFSGNSGAWGGAIYSNGSSLTLTNCTFSSNNASSYGGAFYTGSGTATVTNSTFSSNTATWGGAIINGGSTMTVTNSTFSSNSANPYNGGAIYISSGSSEITNSIFTGNSAVQYGGAIIIQYETVTVTNSIFSGNSAGETGGGVYVQEGNATIANSTFSGNTSVYGGGGIYNYYGSTPSTLTVINSTLSGNSASYTGAGVYNWNGTLNLKNTIQANSTSGKDCYSSTTLGEDLNNLIEINDGCGTPVSSADPNLGTLVNNGGPTQTFALLLGSPAIDAGDDATCTAAPVSGLDQRGVSRLYGTHCDIGSYELRKTSLIIGSVGANDGWILESGENTNAGGTLNAAATTFNLGDEAGDKQYRAILSFNTGALPDTAIITKVTLKIKRPATGYLVGNNNPFTWGTGLKVDVCKTFFGTTAVLQLGDFNFNNPTNCKLLVGAFGNTPAAYWYSANILSTAFTRISKTGTTQFRLRFAKDDNDDNAADYMKVYSGNFATAASRPTLVIEYYVP